MSDSDSDLKNYREDLENTLTEKILALEKERKALEDQQAKERKMRKLQKEKQAKLGRKGKSGQRSKPHRRVENPVPVVVANNPIVRMLMIIFHSQYITTFGERKMEQPIPWAKFTSWGLVPKAKTYT